MPEGRQKFVHGVGAVCKFTLDIQDSPYTGLFKNGVQTGIIRIGPALDMRYGTGIIPGAGIKFLRTGKSSGNIVVSLSIFPSSSAKAPKIWMEYNLNYFEMSKVAEYFC